VSSHRVSWPYQDEAFPRSARARLLLRLALTELTLWTCVVLPPLSAGLVIAIDAALQGERPLLLIVVLAAAGAGTFLIGQVILWGPPLRLRAQCRDAAESWREDFAAAGATTQSLATKVSSLSAFGRPATGLWDEIPQAPRLTAIPSATSSMSFSPRSVAPSLGGSGSLARPLRDELVRALLLLGGSPVLTRSEDDELIAIWQLDKTVQFWSTIAVEPHGDEVRIEENSGYQWWPPRRPGKLRRWREHRLSRPLTTTFWDDIFRSPYARAVRLLSQGLPLLLLAGVFLQPRPWHLVLAAPALALVWWLLRARRAAASLGAFRAAHSPDYGDSLDLALLQNERSFRSAPPWSSRYLERTPAELADPADGRPVFPSVMERIEVQRELVAAAVTQAISEAVNSQNQHAGWRSA